MRRTRAGLNAGKPNSRRDDLVQKVGVLKLFMRVFVQFSNVKRLTILVLLASSAPIARAEQIQITSPDHAYTFAYGAVLSHQAPVKAGPNVDLSDAQKILAEQNRQREDKFADSWFQETNKEDILAKKFEEAMKKAKDAPAGKPIRDFDLD